MEWIVLVLLTAAACGVMWKTLSALSGRHPQLVWFASIVTALILSLVAAGVANARPDWAYFIPAVPLFAMAAVATIKSAIQARKERSQ
ncbi:MAG TPA: hypothetical protein VM242_15355 [Acidimicrobiales bacterium]|nr:hypothetical protein [Acidimicrobiales bacterium]